VKTYLQKKGLQGVLLKKQNNFSWLTAGGCDYVALASESGVASIYFDGEKSIILCNNIEEPRLRDEEVLAGSFEIASYPWDQEKKHREILADLIGAKKVATDGGAEGGMSALERDFDALRYSLLEPELNRYRELGRLCGEAMAEAVRNVQAGQTELQIAGELSRECYSRGVQPVVNLVAADERIYNYRHPLPTIKPLRSYLMIVLCGRKWGLVTSLTRLVHLGKMSAELKKKMDAVIKVDAAFILSSRVGLKLSDVFKRGVEAYEREGYADEWRLHHQGGSTGYNSREIKATLTEESRVLENQAFAWNPSITGVKSEDTIIVLKEAIEIISQTPGLPAVEVECNDIRIRRPYIVQK